jgi:hypothetical protein
MIDLIVKNGTVVTDGELVGVPQGRMLRPTADLD